MENIKDLSENFGTIKISDEVVATIASVALSEIEGVSGLTLTFAGEIAKKITGKNNTKGIKVATVDEETEIDINLTVEYGIKIPEVAWQVQDVVKKNVESMTSLSVSKVNIHVVGVDFNKE